MRYLILTVALLAIGITTAAAQSPIDSKMLIGTWTIRGELGFDDPGWAIGAMSVQADGHIVIAVGVRLGLRGDESIASIPDKDAAERFRDTLIIAGTYEVEAYEPSLNVHIDDANDPKYIGKVLKLGLKVHANSIATGSLTIPRLNQEWRRLSG